MCHPFGQLADVLETQRGKCLPFVQQTRNQENGRLSAGNLCQYFERTLDEPKTVMYEWNSHYKEARMEVD